MPPHSAFYSSLKKSNISLEDYDKSCEFFKEKKMTSLREYLEQYNLRDVVPFVKACKNFAKIFSDVGVDIYKTACSITSVASRILCNCLKKCETGVLLPTKKDLDLINLIRQSSGRWPQHCLFA